MVDRYKAYQAIDKVKSGLIILAFCWAHVRRDFLAVARTWPGAGGWALGWVERIGELYHLNDGGWLPGRTGGVRGGGRAAARP